MWASLQAHRVMQEYTAINFRGHPHLAPVVTLHLYAHHVPRSPQLQGHQGDIRQGLTSRKRQLARLIRSRPCGRLGV